MKTSIVTDCLNYWFELSRKITPWATNLLFTTENYESLIVHSSVLGSVKCGKPKRIWVIFEQIIYGWHIFYSFFILKLWKFFPVTFVSFPSLSIVLLRVGFDFYYDYVFFFLFQLFNHHLRLLFISTSILINSINHLPFRLVSWRGSISIYAAITTTRTAVIWIVCHIIQIINELVVRSGFTVSYDGIDDDGDKEYS